MKKIILAPAVALAFTGLVAAPVAAAETPSTQSAEAKAAEQEKAEKEKAEKEAAAKKAAEKKEAEEKAEAKKKADAKAAAKKKADEKAAEEKKAKEAAEEKDDAKKSAPEPAKKETTPPPAPTPSSTEDGEDESDIDETKPEKINADLRVSTDEVSADDLADSSKGVKVTVTGLEQGDKLSVSGLEGKTVTASSSSETLRVYYSGDAETLKSGAKSFSVKVQRAGVSSVTLQESINVLTSQAEPVQSTMAVDPKEITAADLADESKGLTITLTNLKKGDVVSGTFLTEDKVVPADGDFTFRTYYTGDPGDFGPGNIPLYAYVTRGDADPVTVEGNVTVVDENGVAPIEATLTVDPKEITAEDLANEEKGVKVTVSGVKEGDTITDDLTEKPKTATKDGDYTFTIYYKGNPDNLDPGKVPFTVTIDREGTESQELKGEITVIDDKTEAPAEASLTVTPKSIEAADFINEKKGVKLSVKDCKPGSDVRFMVTADGNSRVTAYDRTVKADKDGKAWVRVFGTSSNASAYVGSYSVTATCGDDSLKGSFKVTAGSNAGGGDGGGDNGSGAGGNDGGSGSGNYLPRTGVELDGLAAGALLLLVGGAAVTITMRRKKGDFSPSYI